MSEPNETSKSGAPIYHHSQRTREFTPVFGNSVYTEKISKHIETHLGPIAKVLHELASDLVHVDIYWIKPSHERPYHTLVTSGMSDMPMTVPEEWAKYQYAELMMHVPKDWPLDQKSWNNPLLFWPIHWLKLLARLPHEFSTFLLEGHTIPNGDPPLPFAPSTKLCCMCLTQPVSTSPEFKILQADDSKTIYFWNVFPLYREEMDYKLEQGMSALLMKLQEKEVPLVLDLARLNVCPL